jgi:hypothetical protein
MYDVVIFIFITIITILIITVCHVMVMYCNVGRLGEAR